jgi:ketosteroid isomerase-like protein
MNRSKGLFLESILLILISLMAPRVSPPQTLPKLRGQSSAEITQVLFEQQTAWNSGDIPAFMKGYWNSPELSFSGSNGVSRGWESVFAGYKRNYPDQATMGHLDFTDLEVRILGPAAALVLGKWHLKRDAGDIGGVFSLVFQRLPEGWKIIHDHTSQVQPHLP